MKLSIGELAERSGLSAPTIRYYEEVGLLPRPTRSSGRRVYEEGTLDRLLVITFAKEAGFKLREIRQLFDGFASDTPAGVRWQELATTKIAELEALAARIEVMKKLLCEALRCGCIDLDACGKLFRGRGASTRPRTAPRFRSVMTETDLPAVNTSTTSSPSAIEQTRPGELLPNRKSSFPGKPEEITTR